MTSGQTRKRNICLIEINHCVNIFSTQQAEKAKKHIKQTNTVSLARAPQGPPHHPARSDRQIYKSSTHAS